MNKHLQILKKNRLRRRKGSKQIDLTVGNKIALSAIAPVYAILHLNHQRKIAPVTGGDALLSVVHPNGQRSIIREGALAVGLCGASYLLVDNVLPRNDGFDDFKLADGL